MTKMESDEERKFHERQKRWDDRIRKMLAKHPLGSIDDGDCTTGPPAPPYPFCRTPEKCAGKGYCPADIACND